MKSFDRTCDAIKVHGVTYFEGIGYGRVPLETADTISKEVSGMAMRSTGGRFRFVTNTHKLRMTVRVAEVKITEILSYLAATGCDVFVGSGKDARFRGIMVPSNLEQTEFSCEMELDGSDNLITVNMSRDATVTDFTVEIDDDADIYDPPAFKTEKPIVFYGSSITEGAGASRPGNAYTSIVSRWLDVDHINLGFDGAAKGEQEMARYIASLDMQLFVLDYDHNEYTVEELEAKHEPFFKTIRELRPDLPIVMLTRPDIRTWPETYEETRKIIIRTYARAIAAGDENVYFVDGKEFFEDDPEIIDCCTADMCHPTDLGFVKMAKKVYPVLRSALGI